MMNLALFIIGLLAVVVAGFVAGTLSIALVLRGIMPMRPRWWVEGVSFAIACLCGGTASILASGLSA